MSVIESPAPSRQDSQSSIPFPVPSGLRVGLTYDLRSEYLARGYSEEDTAEFDQQGTVDALDAALCGLGFETERIGNVERLIERIQAGARWDLVFNICEGLHGIGREGLVPALLDHYQIPYVFSDPLVMATTLDKATAKQLVASRGIPTARFTVVSSATERPDLRDLDFPLFVKPLAEGTGKGVNPASIVRDRQQLEERCSDLLLRYQQPVLVETYLPGRELTVGILGTGLEAEVLGTLEIVLLAGAEPGAYSYVNKENCEELVEYRSVGPADPVVAEAERVALEAWQVLGCRDGGRVDLRCDAAGTPCFLEVNPLAGLHPEHSDLPIIASAKRVSYGSLIERIVRSALARTPVLDGAEHAGRITVQLG